MDLNQFKEVLALLVEKQKDGNTFVDIKPLELGDSFVLDMPHKRRLFFLLLGGVVVSGNRVGINKGVVSCVSPEAATYFPLGSVVAISNTSFTVKEKK